MGPLLAVGLVGGCVGDTVDGELYGTATTDMPGASSETTAGSTATGRATRGADVGSDSGSDGADSDDDAATGGTDAASDSTGAATTTVATSVGTGGGTAHIDSAGMSWTTDRDSDVTGTDGDVTASGSTGDGGSTDTGSTTFNDSRGDQGSSTGSGTSTGTTTGGTSGSASTGATVTSTDGRDTGTATESGTAGGSDDSGTDSGTTGAGTTGTGSSTGTSGTTGGVDPDPPLDPAELAACDQPVGAPGDDTVMLFQLHFRYTKYLDAGGIPIVGSSAVDDEAIRRTCRMALAMLAARPDVRTQLFDARVRVGVIGKNEVTTDMPEYELLPVIYPMTDWDAFRGLGATPDTRLSSVGEENVLCLPGDIYAGENIMVHEFGHTIFTMGIEPLPGGGLVRAALTAAYDAAMLAGLWSQTYAETNENEYWAEAVQSWYDANLTATPPDGIHNHVGDRAALRAYDAEIADLIEAELGAHTWDFGCP